MPRTRGTADIHPCTVLSRALRNVVADAMAGTNDRARAQAMKLWRYYGQKMREELKRRGLLEQIDELNH